MVDAPHFYPGQQRTVEFCAFLAGGVAAVMLGLSLGARLPGSGSLLQRPLSAVLLLAMSLAVFQVRRGGRASRTGLVLAFLAGGVSACALLAYSRGLGPAWLAQADLGHRSWPRMSFLTALSVVALALAYLTGAGFPRAPWRRRQCSALLAMVPMVLGCLVLMSYPQGAPLLNGAQSAQMTLPSALSCALLGLAILNIAGNDVWPLALFGSESARTETRGGRWLRRGPLRVFLVSTLAILTLGSLLLKSQVKAARREAQRQLAATTDAKARQITVWFRERQGDADQILQSSLLRNSLLRALAGDPSSRAGVLEWMASLSRRSDYSRVALFDGQGLLRLGLPGDRSDSACPSPGPWREALLSRKVEVVDLHRGADGSVHLCFWIPLGSSVHPGQPAPGLMLLQVDAERFLFPLLGPAAHGDSAETFLVRREGGAPVDLGGLRVRPERALDRRVSFGSMSGLGQQGRATGLDDRGRRVLVALRPIPGTPWSMVGTVDEAGIFGQFRRWAWMSVLGLLGLLVLLAMVMGLMVRQGDARRILAQLAFARERKDLAENFSKAFSTCPDAMSINRLGDGVYLKINEGFSLISGYSAEELLGRSSLDMGGGLWADEQDRARMVAGLLDRGEVLDLEAQFRRKDGSLVTGLMSAKLLTFEAEACVLSSTRDLTQRKQAEEERRLLQAQLHQSQKQESLGALAGGVAHDMNNVLGAILSLASSDRTRLEAGDPLAKSFETIIKACLRGRGVVKSLLCFARKELEQTQPVDLNAVVREVVALLAHTTLQRMTLDTELQDGLGTVQGDACALSHALVNLCMNAMDAMPGGGRVLVRTENLGSSRVRLTVADTGTGMSAEVQEKALEPFFTTKPVGKGTGLGLAMVFGTVQAHGGTLEIQSRLGQGSSVLLTFPAATVPGAFLTQATETVAQGAPLAILLVDDDQLIRASVAPMLALVGHQVSTAEGGQEALALLAAGLRVDLVILDLNMPGMNGAQTLGHLLALNPAQVVLLASGYNDGEVSELMEGRPTVSFLQKPFTLVELQGKLPRRAELDSSRKTL